MPKKHSSLTCESTEDGGIRITNQGCGLGAVVIDVFPCVENGLLLLHPAALDERLYVMPGECEDGFKLGTVKN